MKKATVFIQVFLMVFVLSFVMSGVSLAEEQKSYNFPEAGFSVSFPVSWTVEKAEGGCDAKAADIIATVKISDEGKMEVSLEEFASIYRVELKKQFSKDYKEEKFENQTVGGHKAKLISFSTVESGVTVKGDIYIVDVEGKCTQIMLITNDTAQAQAAPIFKKIIESVKFL